MTGGLPMVGSRQKKTRWLTLFLALWAVSCTGIKPKAGTISVIIEADVPEDTGAPVVDTTASDTSTGPTGDSLSAPEVSDVSDSTDGADTNLDDAQDVLILEDLDVQQVDEVSTVADLDDGQAVDMDSDVQSTPDVLTTDASDVPEDLAELDVEDGSICPITSPQCAGAPAPYWTLSDHQEDPPVERNIQEFLGKVTVVVFLEST